MIKTLDLNTSVTLNEFEDVTEQIDAVRNRFFAANETRSKLVDALYEIRRKVATANADAGINDMLSSVARAEKIITFNTMLASKGTQTALRVLNGQVQKNAEAKDDIYSHSRRDVVTSIFTEAEIEGFKRIAADYKRTKQRLQDTLLELNVQTTIELTESSVAALKAADIL
jgi:hypothetical protein